MVTETTVQALASQRADEVHQSLGYGPFYWYTTVSAHITYFDTLLHLDLFIFLKILPSLSWCW